MEHKDRIMSILKSLTPIGYKFSRKNRELDETFKTMSLQNLMRVIDHHPKYHDEFTLPSEYLNNRNVYGINFKNSNEYIDELSDLNNLPIVIHNKNYLKGGKFNEEYDINSLNNKKEKMKILREKEKRKKEREKERFKIFKKRKYENSKVDSLKYNPNYNFIKRKIFSFHIRPPSVKKVRRTINGKYNEKKKKNLMDININEDHTNNQTQNIGQNLKQNSSVIFFDRIKNDLHIKDNNKNGSNKNIIKSNNKDIFSNKNNNSSIFNDSNTNLSNSSILRLPKLNNFISNNLKSRNISKIKIKVLNLKNRLKMLGKNSSTNSDYNTVELNKSTNIEDATLFHKDSEKISNIHSERNIKVNKRIFLPNIKKKFKRPLRSKSNNEIKHCIYFKKMLGRKDDLFLEKNLNLISYFPNYDFLRPHIPNTIFKIKKDEINYKKYILGKIIRNYNYSPEKYFVFEYGKHKQKKLNQNRERLKMFEILKEKAE